MDVTKPYKLIRPGSPISGSEARFSGPEALLHNIGYVMCKVVGRGPAPIAPEIVCVFWCPSGHTRAANRPAVQKPLY
jgi:hypothetical protein